MVYLSQKKAHTLLYFIAVFLVLDVVVFGLNYYSSGLIAEQAQQINLAGRQRMLLQIIAKNASFLGQESAPVEAVVQLHSSAWTFDSTLRAFQQGGETMGADGTPITLPRLTNDQSVQMLDWAELLWRPIKDALDTVTDTTDLDQYEDTRIFILSNESELLSLMNDLTVQLETMTRKETKMLRQVHSAASILALANFLLIVRLFSRRLLHTSQNQQFLNEVINRIDAAVLVHKDNGTIIRCNTQAAVMFDLSLSDLLGRNIHAMLRSVDLEELGWRHDGSTFFARVRNEKLLLDSEVLTITTIHDISDTKLREKSLVKLAYQDPLTGLPNRLLFEERLDGELHRAHRYKEQFAIFFLDLDGFKAVNDQFGHDVGDKLLSEVSSRLTGNIRETDTVARLGGDEFVILYTGINSDLDCQTQANNILDEISSIRNIDDHAVKLGVSIGISLYPKHASDADTLVALADSAMYKAKKLGKNTYQIAES
jgi:diguanylate cyclase (GGDEF)-like protein